MKSSSIMTTPQFELPIFTQKTIQDELLGYDKVEVNEFNTVQNSLKYKGMQSTSLIKGLVVSEKDLEVEMAVFADRSSGFNRPNKITFCP
ncbi:MAG: hypothetical protein R2827_05460 [Bdellovibrionales bacterium]